MRVTDASRFSSTKQILRLQPARHPHCIVLPDWPTRFIALPMRQHISNDSHARFATLRPCSEQPN